jgi:hypothetical protein
MYPLVAARGLVETRDGRGAGKAGGSGSRANTRAGASGGTEVS